MRDRGTVRPRLPDLAVPDPAPAFRRGRRAPPRAGQPGRRSTSGCSGWSRNRRRRRNARPGRPGWRLASCTDVAVGAHPGGADAWAGHDVFVRDVSVGAPPRLLQPERPELVAAALAPRAPGRAGLPPAGRPDGSEPRGTLAGCGSTTRWACPACGGFRRACRRRRAPTCGTTTTPRLARWPRRWHAPARSRSARISAPWSPGCGTRCGRAVCSAPRCCGSSQGRTGRRCRRRGGGATASPPSPPTTCRRPPPSSPGSR